MAAPLSWQHSLTQLLAQAQKADCEIVWPDASWQTLRQAGVLGWRIPAEYGGQGFDPVKILEGYEALASVCLTTCFILSQRDAACRRILDSSNNHLRRDLLPALARGEQFATVGLSHLTTSRQHVKPSLIVQTRGDQLVLDGTIPWVTGASKASHFVIGGVLEDGRQILAVMPRELQGVHVGPPLELMALRGSVTAEIICEQVELDSRFLLAGPSVEVMKAGGQGGAGGLETTCLAPGLAGAAIEYLNKESVARAEYQMVSERLKTTYSTLKMELHRLAMEGGEPQVASLLRARANSLVLRATQTALTAGKGAGFLMHHPAQRWARQALFFLVWSCPRTTAQATLAYLSPPEETMC